MGKLAGKIALISGGTSGIGAATAKLFQAEGATVIVTGSSQKTVDAVAPSLTGIELIVSDASDVAATKALVDHVKAKHGRIDVLFVNAGVARFAPAADIDEAFFDAQFNVNVKGAFFLIKHAAPVLSDGGSVILTASVAGSTGGLPGATVYGATKAALRSFGRTFARELSPRGVRVNTISPGPIDTPIFLTKVSRRRSPAPRSTLLRKPPSLPARSFWSMAAWSISDQRAVRQTARSDQSDDDPGAAPGATAEALALGERRSHCGPGKE
jgi:NAD(P)-dependent dehydrogenase (short-subunit alcohol dehydrogenase family)